MLRVLEENIQIIKMFIWILGPCRHTAASGAATGVTLRVSELVGTVAVGPREGVIGRTV